MSGNRQPVPPRTSPRVRQSSVDAAALRRLAARRARAAAAREAVAPLAPDQAAQDAAPQESESRVLTAAQHDDSQDQAPSGKPGHSPSALRLIALLALAAATLAFGGLAAWFGTEAGSLTGEPSGQNQALANPTETSQVTSQVTSAIDALFSYSYTSPGSTTKAASRVLTGAAVRQYAALFAEVKAKAPREKLIVTTKVSSAGVELLTPDAARVLVFAAESDGSAGASTPSTAGAMLAVNMVLDGGTWKISGIDTFSG